MKLLLTCALLTALACVCFSYLPSKCEEDLERQLANANRGKDSMEIKRLLCDAFEMSVIKCTEREMKNSSLSDKDHREIGARLDELRKTYGVACRSCGGPTVLAWLLALPLLSVVLNLAKPEGPSSFIL